MRVVNITGLIVVILCFAAAAASGDQPPEGKPHLTSIFTFKAIEIGEGDGELARLLKQRFNAAGQELDALSALYIGGRVALREIEASIGRFAKAGLELHDAPAQRVEHLEKTLAAAKNVEAVVRTKVLHQVEPAHALNHANYVRLDLEIQLYRARELAKAKVLRK